MDPIGQLRRFQANRSRPERDLTIGGQIRSTAETATRTHKRLGELIELWNEIVPEDLGGGTIVTALRGGVLHVTVDSSSRLYELDRALRGGVTAELRRRYSGTLTRVRLALAS